MMIYILQKKKKRKGDSGDSGELEIKKGMNSKQN